ncbi:MAG: MFS transporter, partial [Candidatus Fonsibacter sp.]
VGTAYIADITTKKNRAKGMGMFGMAFGLGFTIGPMLGGLIAGSNYTFESLSNVAWIAFFINIINLIFVIFFLKEPKKIQGRIHSKIFDKFSNQLTFLFERKLSIFFLIIFIIYFGFTGMEGIFAIWINETFNWGPQEVGLIMLYAGICQIVVQGFILRYLLNFFNEVQLIKSGFIFLITGFLLISTNQFYILLIAVAFLCYGIGVSNPCLNSIVSKNCNKNKKGLALGAAYSAQSIARFTGQPFAGLLFLYFGKDMPFITNAFILGGFSLIYFLFLKKTLNKAFR